MSTAPLEVDVVVVGSGCFGSLAALIAARTGHSVALLERGRHPRFAIGESTTPLANLLIEELARRHELPWLGSFSKWGSWRRAHPEVRCGRKRGFTFLAHERGRPFAARGDMEDQWLVAASSRAEIADTHWMRADLDAYLVDRACEAGVTYLDGFAVERLNCERGRCELHGNHGGSRLTVGGRLLVDATGPRGLMWRELGSKEVEFRDLPATSGLYTHVRGARQIASSSVYPFTNGLPYPVDEAAVHHVLQDGWVWSLAFDDGITSVGVAATPSMARELRLEEGAAAWSRLLERQPTLAELFADAEAVQPWTHVPRMSFRSAQAAGEGWVMTPAAAGFVDPLLSTGFALSLLGLLRLGDSLESNGGDLGGDRLARALTRLGALTLQEVDRVGRLVAAMYGALGDFPLFRKLTHLYFAAVHHAETRVRLGRASADLGFLGGDVPGFADEMEGCCQAAISLASRPDPEGRSKLMEQIDRAVAPIDLLGLDRSDRQAWCPVDLDETRQRAARIGATPEEIEALLARS